MNDLNKFLLIGRIGYIEQKPTSNGSQSTVIVVYVSDDYKAQDGTWVNRSHRFMVTFYGTRADGIFKAFSVKDRVWIEANVVTTESDDGSGNKTTNIYFRGAEIQKIASGDSNDQSASTSASTGKTKASKGKGGGQRPRSNWSKTQQPEVDVDSFLDDDDIPF